MDKSWFPTVSDIYNPLPVFWVENECIWSKMTFFRRLEVLEGTFIRTYVSQRLFGMHSGSVLSGWNAGNANTDLSLSIKPICRVYTGSTGSTGSFFRCLEVLEGTFVRTYMRQSCLGCILEVF